MLRNGCIACQTEAVRRVRHSPASIYSGVTPIERDHFDMFFFSALKSYNGAFHMSRDCSWWCGYADVLGHLATIRDEAGTICSADATRNRTTFVRITGSLMVPAVLAGVWGVRRATGGPKQRPTREGTGA